MTQETVKLRYLRLAPRKVRSVAQVIAGLPTNEAEAQLLFLRRRAAKPLLKLLRSAMANVKNNHHDPHQFFVRMIRVDGGPRLKRYLPRARGLATPIQKKMSHVTIVLGKMTGVKPVRFSIHHEPKVKTEGGRKRVKKTAPEVSPSEPRDESASRGFLKRVFRRKSGMGS